MTPSIATIVLQGGAGPDRWKAANDAARAATADVLVFVPEDLAPATDLLARVTRTYEAGRPGVLVADVSPADGSHPLAAMRRARARDAAPVIAADFAGQVFSTPAPLFHRAGGFADDISWGAEVELAFRLAALGGELDRLEGTAGTSRRRRSAHDVLRERETTGRGSAELYRRTPSLLPQLELGGFHAGGPPGLGLRRGLLALGGPGIPGGFDRLVPSPAIRDRWLRFLFEYYYWRGVRRVIRGAAWAGLARPPVILMYHAVGHPGEPAGRYIVPLPRFRRQMRWLALRGYRVIGLDELVEHRRANRPPPPRSVVITFDDGYADNGQLAAPVLRSFGFPATVFVVSGSFGERNGWDAAGELAGRPILTREEARAMAESGIEIGAHTRTHPRLSELAAAAVLDEVGGCRRDLEAALDRPTRTFAYPFGALNDAVAAAVAASGFDAACCSRSGRNDPSVPPMLLRRVEICGTDSLLEFARAVHRGYKGRSRS